MKKILLIMFVALAFPAMAISQDNGEPGAREIVNRAEDAIQGETSVGTFTMEIVRPDYTRTVTMKAWNKGYEKALIVTKAPKKEAGNKLLKIGNGAGVFFAGFEIFHIANVLGQKNLALHGQGRYVFQVCSGG